MISYTCHRPQKLSETSCKANEWIKHIRSVVPSICAAAQRRSSKLLSPPYSYHPVASAEPTRTHEAKITCCESVSSNRQQEVDLNGRSSTFWTRIDTTCRTTTFRCFQSFSCAWKHKPRLLAFLERLCWVGNLGYAMSAATVGNQDGVENDRGTVNSHGFERPLQPLKL